MQSRVPIVVFILAVFAGFVFSSVSTYDFVQHLDRQVHAIHCSFVPGAGVDVAGTSGCKAVMMSPYASWFRSVWWGGIPISLLAMAVYAFLLFRGTDMLVGGRLNDRRSTGFLLAATGLPVVMSLVYGGIAGFLVGAFCKLCVGVYVSSALAFAAALRIHFARVPDWEEDPEPQLGSSTGYNLASFGQGVAYVVIILLLYLVFTPDFSAYAGTCGTLVKPDDPYGILVPLKPKKGGTPAIEILDPLCPACAGFDQRLEASGLGDELDLSAVLFPMDSECNWMVPDEIHPGACTISEAVLCAGDDAPAVVAWAFENQEQIRKDAAEDKKSARKAVVAAFPKLANCVGKPSAKSKLNRSLRWTVKNSLPVLTPQLYVDGIKLCDEDTDLGMDYMLPRLLAQVKGGAE